MTQPLIENHTSVFQSLTFLPGRNISDKPSTARIILYEALENIVQEPGCTAVYWMRDWRNASRIVVISQWKDIVYNYVHKKHYRDLIPHLREAPTVTTYLELSCLRYTENKPSSFLTLAFPAKTCTPLFQSNTNAKIQDIWKLEFAALHLSSVVTQWSEEEQVVNGMFSTSLLIYSSWSDDIADVSYRRWDGYWKAFVSRLMHLGAHHFEESYGELCCMVTEDERSQRTCAATHLVRVPASKDVTESRCCGKSPLPPLISPSIIPAHDVSEAESPDYDSESDSDLAQPILTPSSSCETLYYPSHSLLPVDFPEKYRLPHTSHIPPHASTPSSSPISTNATLLAHNPSSCSSELSFRTWSATTEVHNAKLRFKKYNQSHPPLYEPMPQSQPQKYPYPTQGWKHPPRPSIQLSRNEDRQRSWWQAFIPTWLSDQESGSVSENFEEKD